jgi:xanthine dehydrogenase accessory factor
MFDNFFSLAHTLTQSGEAFATAIVVRAEKPTSGKPGDCAIITRDGVMHGWIGGSCAQPTVIKEARNALREDKPRMIRLSVDPLQQTPRDGLIDLPMTCYSGGTLEIYIEPHHPRPRLLIVGNLPVAQALAHLGKAMNYHVVAFDLENSGAMSHADECLLDLSALKEKINPITYVVVATHGNYDETALEQALKSNAPYVGLVASPKRAESVRQFLREAGLSDSDMLALKSPAGLDIQARRGDEIALSIMAEIVQKRRNAERLFDALFEEEKNTAAVLPTKAIDPVCGMEVEIATAIHMSDYNGQTFYFCCPHCKKNFERNPEKWLDKSKTL